jgi:GalNAc-alpha-(1->4)-GalNAc-alpha-(1->3)-diNAcBac-PP-undecaprenol alpha-1,4-N-acetyl-D-galactosaminyltransferase
MASSMNTGGAERVLSEIANYWINKNHNITLISTHYRSLSSSYELDKRINFLPLAFIAKKYKLLRHVGLIGKLFIIYLYIRKCKPDVIISFLTNVNILSIIAAKLTKTPIIISERVNPKLMDLPIIFKIGRFILYRYANVLVVQTNDIRSVLSKSYRNLDIKVIENPIPIIFEKANKWTYKDKEKKYLLAVGRLSYQKNYLQLIRVYHDICYKHKNWNLIIVGKGPQSKEINDLIKKFGIEDRVEIVNESENILHYYQYCDLFIILSLFEGFPNVLLEAMAIGIPTVSANFYSGAKELTDDGRVSFLLRNRDDIFISEFLDRLLNNSNLLLSKCELGRNYVLKNYNSLYIMSKWDSIINSFHYTETLNKKMS